jgi:hypothetical protein
VAPALPVLAGIAALGAVVMVAVVDPNHPGHYPVCPSLLLFGVYCPGCGSMRAIHDLAHLDIAGAWGMNPLVFAVIPYVAWQWLRWLVESLGRPLPRRLAPAWTIWLVFAGILAFGVARNVPALAPFLAP